ncbi:9357_t:CDS:1, partial [Scutellospora calospora]
MSIETTNTEESPSLKLIEVEMTSVETQCKTKAITTTRNVAKSIEGIKTTQEDVLDLTKSLDD